MTYKVSLSTNSYSVKFKAPQKYKISVSAEAGSVAGNLSDLSDVNVSGIQNGYLLMYNAPTGQFVAVNPDTVLSQAATEPVSPGLPADFEAVLDVDLDNRINLDGGGF